ncbi:ATP-binding protein [Crateriforma conspicua]|uniref:AAA-like domain protein n=1 Tax=Crateriforma conspicua TaxID=2527996 RepID=A0A5C5YCI6_9PLAN|nr:ATP-binding protein [Crateriforma conspicua]TWT72493.1 AAA-like domain protein [Crateriforma conspicua]
MPKNDTKANTPDPKVFEKLSAFYLGRHYDLQQGEMLDDLLMYDAKDLCTHAMCVGMTGSGKTGLCLSLLEEAAIDGIPAICVDPKGDLANLLLTFPDLKPEDFKPWLESGEATRQGKTLDELAESTATMWRDGLASWGQDGQRIRRLKEAVDVAIYTPGSNIGLPMTVLRSFDAPTPEELEDGEAVAERITGAVSGLLTLIGIDADPMVSPEHILVSSILQHEWSEGKSVAVAQLIRLIQSPPISRVGVLDLESFMPATERAKLAMRLNNLLASPAFASWLEGESLSIQDLYFTAEGKPRLTILSIAHLNENERMFFVTILLNELLAWTRRQSGTSSLRAMFYMDEVAGYFPPVANPPSKPPMLTLLKQARAFGVGITLATQNPVDLDYKGLSNIGTWFLGRLQTERDKARVLEGLEGAASESGQTFDRGQMEQTLAGLGKRVFLMNNVHDGFPSVFQTRWAMSFLAGPLARNQISRLMRDRKQAMAAAQTDAGDEDDAGQSDQPRPVVPAGIEECFLVPQVRSTKGCKRIYRPALLVEGSMRFSKSSLDLEHWRDICHLERRDHGFPDPLWETSAPLHRDVERSDEPEPDFVFKDLPNELISKAKYRSYRSQFKDYMYRHCTFTLYRSVLLDEEAKDSKNRGEAMAYFRQRYREEKDRLEEKLRDKIQSKVRTLENKLHKAQERVDREAAQSSSSMISAGATLVQGVLGAFLGGRRTGMSTVARSATYANRQRLDVKQAEQAMDRLRDDISALEDELGREIDRLNETYDPERIEIDTTEIPPRKGDLKAETPVIAWVPWQVDADGIATPLVPLEPSLES